MSAKQLYSAQLERIYKKLPLDFIALVDEYPIAIASAAEDYEKPRLPEGFSPSEISIYLDEYSNGPAIYANKDSGVVNCTPEFWVDNPRVFIMDFNDECVYVRVGKIVVLDRLPQDYVLPDLKSLKLSFPIEED